MKRILSLLLAMVLVVGLLPMGALADGDENTGAPGATSNATTTDTTNTTNTDTTGGDATDTPPAASGSKLRTTNASGESGTGESGTKKQIDLSGVTFSQKEYDGSCTVTVPQAANDKLPAGTQLSLSASVEDPNVGKDKKVTVTLGGDDAGSYELTGTENLTVEIIQASVSGVSGNTITVSNSVTLYKQVARSYEIELATILPTLGTNCTWNGTAGDTPTLTLNDEGDNKPVFAYSSDIQQEVTSSISGTKVTLNFAANLTGIDANKNQLTIAVTSQNYQDFSIKVPLEVTDLTHTVKFDANVPEGDRNPVSGTMEDQTVSNNTVTKLNKSNFTRDNYTFKGWSTAASGGAYSEDEQSIKINETTPQTITLYARWEAKTENRPDMPTAAALLKGTMASIYAGDDTQPTLSVDLADCNPKITVSGNDVDGYTATVVFDKAFWDGIQPTLSSSLCNKLANTDRKGGSWRPEDAADYAYSDDTPQTLTYTYSPQDSGTLVLPPDGTSDLPASPWTASEDNKQIGIRMYQYFTVTYTLSDIPESLPEKDLKGETYTVKKGEAWPKYQQDATGGTSCYQFAWYIGDVKQTDMPETVDRDYSLTGKWTPITFTVQFKKGAEDATGTMDPMTVTYGSDATLTPNAFRRTGYRFARWKIDGIPEDITYEDKAGAGKLGNYQGEVVILVAQWEQAVNQVDFSLSGYDITKFVTQIGVTTDTKNVQVYKNESGEEVFWVSCDDKDITSETATFGADKIYYLHVMFVLDEGYADGGLTTETVRLDGRNAKSLTAPNDDTPGYIATFQLPVIRKITVKRVTKNGTITPGEDFYAKDGEKVTFKVTPSTGYLCSTFKVDGEAKKLTKNTYELTVSKSHTVKVWFAKDSGNAKTGDDLRLIYLAAAGIVSLAALTALTVVGIKKKKKK